MSDSDAERSSVTAATADSFRDYETLVAEHDKCPDALAAAVEAETWAAAQGLDVARLARALQATVHSTEVRTLHGYPVRWDDLNERNHEVALREAAAIARAYAGVES